MIMEALISGLKINYKILGEGRPFLILHGWGSKSDKWEKTAVFLSRKGFKTIIPDLPGFGKSEMAESAWTLDDYCDFVKKFAEFLKLDKFYLLGHSFGGAVSVKFCLKHSQKVEKLYLVASSCVRKKNIKKRILLAISKIFKVFSFIPLFRKAFYKFIVRKSDYIYTKGVMKETFLKIVKEDLSPFLSSVKTPAVIIWGDKDDVIPIEDIRIMNREIKNSKLIIIPDATHNVEQEMPDILAQKILENL